MRLTDGYIFVPSDKDDAKKLLITREDSPELLPSSKRHVWGRLLTLGSVGVKVSLNGFVYIVNLLLEYLMIYITENISSDLCIM